MKIYFVRHGESTANDERIYSGHLDVELTEKGKNQAIKCKEFLKDIEFQHVVSSDLKRARDTAQIICEERDIEINESKDLREMNFGIWEGLSNSQIIEKYKEQYNMWINDYTNLKAPEGESLKEFYHRAVSAYDDIKSKYIIKSNESIDEENDNNILVVSHSGVIKSLISYEMGNGLDGYWKYAIENCSVSVIEYDKTGYGFLRNLNFTGRL